MFAISDRLPEGAAGLQLCKVERGVLKISEPVLFARGAEGVDVVLRRAAIAGKVGPLGETGDYWADLLDRQEDTIETIALDRAAWNALKKHWMRCRMLPDG